MADESVTSAQGSRSAQRVALALVCVGIAACAVVAGLQADVDRLHGLAVVLLVSAVVAGATVVPSLGRASISAGFIVLTLAAALLGPASAALCAVATEVTAARKLRTPLPAALFNVLGSAGPAIIAADLIRGVHPAGQSLAFYLLVGAGSLIILTLNFAVISIYFPIFRGERTLTASLVWDYAPTQALNIAMAMAGAGIYVKVGLAGIVFALLALFSFAYMAHLLEQSSRRAEQYVSLSWGVLAGLMRSLDVRDGRAARHAAAVAAFARDMAEQLGMSEAEQELAHTAGLLHDIGHFALSDRVHERGRTLTEEDWVAIQRHPELGADVLRDLGMYGPVAEIVLAHHERIDGRGYPHGLDGEEIPAIAKLIAVAEVYDTLTAQDTYRTQMSSFEALRELRRVAGSQLEAEYVEILAGLLTGEGVAYRHANAADFDAELDMERRIRQARAS
jgi:putative nucleotidyltransferase with HDIG domain